MRMIVRFVPCGSVYLSNVIITVVISFVLENTFSKNVFMATCELAKTTEIIPLIKSNS